RDLDTGADPLQLGEVGGTAAARPIEVDHVQHAGATIGETASGLQRIGVVDSLLIEVPARQADRLTVEDVDCGKEDHSRAEAVSAAEAAPSAFPCAHRRAKLASISKPSDDDFSGWNWTPKTLSRCTIVANRSPYSAVPMTWT